MSRSLSINFYLRPCSIVIYGKFHLYHLNLFRNFSGLSIVQIWYMNYGFHFGSVKIHKHFLYWSVFSTHIQRKIFFNSLLIFKLFLLVSNWVESVNSTNVFWHAQKLRQGLYSRAVSIFIVIHGKFIPNF